STPLRSFGLGVRARVLLASGCVDEALCAAKESVAQLLSTGGSEEDESLPLLAHAEALEARGEHAAACDALRVARDRLERRAALIARSDWRESFLRRVPEHARTLDLARDWFGGSSA